jgi:hypothetical protein
VHLWSALIANAGLILLALASFNFLQFSHARNKMANIYVSVVRARNKALLLAELDQGGPSIKPAIRTARNTRAHSPSNIALNRSAFISVVNFHLPVRARLALR